MCLRRKYHPNYQHSSRIPPNGALLLHCLSFIHVTFDLFLPAFVRNGVNVRIVNTLSTLKHHEVLTEDQDPFHFYFFCLYIRFPRALMFTTVMIDDGAKAGLSPVVVVVEVVVEVVVVMGWVKRVYGASAGSNGRGRKDRRPGWLSWTGLGSLPVHLRGSGESERLPLGAPYICDTRRVLAFHFRWRVLMSFNSSSRCSSSSETRATLCVFFCSPRFLVFYFILIWFDLIFFCRLGVCVSRRFSNCNCHVNQTNLAEIFAFDYFDNRITFEALLIFTIFVVKSRRWIVLIIRLDSESPINECIWICFSRL